MTTLQKIKEERYDFLDKTFLIFRPNDFPMLIKPIRSRVPSVCELTGKEIEAGDYVYPCLRNPVRLTPYGSYRVKVNAAIKKGNSILPQGYYALPIPTTEHLQKKGLLIDKRRDTVLKGEVLKLLERKS